MRERAHRQDAGTTLVELLITMAVFTLVAALSARVTVSISKSVAATSTFADAVARTRLALGSIERDIRSGDVLFNPADENTVNPSCLALSTSAGSCMRVYTELGGDAQCVQWQVLSDTAAAGTAYLRTRSFSPAWRVDGDVGTWRAVTRGLQLPSSGTPPFTLMGGSTPYSSRLLQVSLVATDPSRAGRVTTLTSSLSGRNTTYGSDTSLCFPGPS